MTLYSLLVRHVLYPLDRWRSGDGAELRFLREFEQSQFLPVDELRALTLERLRRLVAHAYGHCAYYRRLLDSVGFVPSDLNSPEDLSAIPVLEKRHIQQHRDEMVADNWPQDDLIRNQTGGSTGSPISFFLSHERECSRAAATWRHNRWAGWEIGDKVAAVWGALRDAPHATWKDRIRNKLLDRILWFNTAHITEEKLKRLSTALNRHRPKHVLAYAKSLALVARYFKSERLWPPRPQSIVTSAEVLEPADRALIEKVFGCPVFNRYGCREVSVIASECSEHDGMHLMAEGLHVEVVRGGRPAPPGELGEVLVTDLLNLAMPLVRYRIGDMASYDPTPCGCGRRLPRLTRLGGRVTDFLVGSDGRLVSGAFLTVGVVAKRPSLGQVQLWQDAPGRVLYKIAPGEKRSPDEADFEFLQRETKRYLGSDAKVEYELVDALSAEPSGKFLFCRSSVACDFVDRPVAEHGPDVSTAESSVAPGNGSHPR